MYVGDTIEKDLVKNVEKLTALGFEITLHDKMPDVVLYREDKDWIYFVESVTSVGPMDSKRIPFWSLCRYMVRSRKGIEMLVNLINISYCAMKLLPYMDKAFAAYRGGSVQEFRFALSERIRRQVFYANLVQNAEIHIKSTILIKALKRLCFKQMD